MWVIGKLLQRAVAEQQGTCIIYELLSMINEERSPFMGLVQAFEFFALAHDDDAGLVE